MGNCPHYQVLNVPETATADEIKKAYFIKLREYPPNKYPEEFKKIRKAFEILSDEKKRKACNEYGDLSEKTIEEFLEEFKNTPIKDLHEHNVEIMGQKINLDDYLCDFCKRRIGDIKNPIEVNVKIIFDVVFIDGSSQTEYIEIGNFPILNRCPSCNEISSKLMKINKRVITIEFILIISLIIITILFNGWFRKYFAVLFAIPVPLAIAYNFYEIINNFQFEKWRESKKYNDLRKRWNDFGEKVASFYYDQYNTIKNITYHLKTRMVISNYPPDFKIKNLSLLISIGFIAIIFVILLFSLNLDFAFSFILQVIGVASIYYLFVIKQDKIYKMVYNVYKEEIEELKKMY